MERNLELPSIDDRKSAIKPRQHLYKMSIIKHGDPIQTELKAKKPKRNTSEFINLKTIIDLQRKKNQKMQKIRIEKQAMNSFNKQSLEPLRDKMGHLIMSIESNKQILEENVIRVKGKVLNSFLGILKTDIPRLAIEAFPATVNKKLICLQLLNKYDIVWFDV